MNAVNNSVNNIEHFDVLVVGAGLSGIGSAYHSVSYTHLTLPTICSV